MFASIPSPRSCAPLLAPVRSAAVPGGNWRPASLSTPSLWQRAHATGRDACRRLIKISTTTFATASQSTAAHSAAAPWLSCAATALLAAPAAPHIARAVARCGVPALAMGSGAAAVTALALALATGSMVAMQAIGDRLGRKDWVHAPMAANLVGAAIGLALAPWLAMGPVAWRTVSALPVPVCAAALLSILTSTRQGLFKVDVPVALFSVALALAVGPAGFMVLGGVAPNLAVGHSLAQAAGWACVVGIAVAVGRLVTAPKANAGLDYLQVADAVTERFTFDATLERPASILNVQPEVRAFFRDINAKAERIAARDGRFSGFEGLGVQIMHGPPGTGKSLSAYGGANAVKSAKLVVITPADLGANTSLGLPSAALKLIHTLNYYDDWGKRHGRVVIVALEEVDALLPSATDGPDDHDYSKIVGFILLRESLNILSRGKTSLALLMTTNNLTMLAPWLAMLTTRRPTLVDVPDQHQLDAMWQAKLKALDEELYKLSLNVAPISEHEDLQRLHARLAALGISGRTLNFVNRAAGMAAVFCAQQTQTRDASLTDAAHTCRAAAFEAMDKAIAHLEAEQEEAQKQKQNTAMQPGVSIKELERTMQRQGLEGLNSLEIITALATNSVKAYFNPEHVFALTETFVSGIQVLLALSSRYAVNAVRADVTPDFVDVPQRAPMGHDRRYKLAAVILLHTMLDMLPFHVGQKIASSILPRLNADQSHP